MSSKNINTNTAIAQIILSKDHEIRVKKKTKKKSSNKKKEILDKVKKFQLHRLIYEVYNGKIPEGMLIDHIDNNKTNNNIDNLRLATDSENNCNKKVNKNNLSTGYKNISLTKWNSYDVKITKNKKIVYRKNFKTLEEAIENRDIQLVLIHGEFHNLG